MIALGDDNLLINCCQISYLVANNYFNYHANTVGAVIYFTIIQVNINAFVLI